VPETAAHIAIITALHMVGFALSLWMLRDV
jgi:hypothetical protein